MLPFQLPHENPHPLWPWDFEEILRKYKAPFWTSIGIECNRWGARPREEAGFDAHGTIWTVRSVIWHDKRGWHDSCSRIIHGPVPCNQIPYGTIRTAEWDEEDARWKTKLKGFQGELKKGWRPLLVDLVRDGVLSPHPDLTFLIGYDTRKLVK